MVTYMSSYITTRLRDEMLHLVDHDTVHDDDEVVGLVVDRQLGGHSAPGDLQVAVGAVGLDVDDEEGPGRVQGDGEGARRAVVVLSGAAGLEAC